MTKADMLKYLADLPDDTDLVLWTWHEDGSRFRVLECALGNTKPGTFLFSAGIKLNEKEFSAKHGAIPNLERKLV